MHGSIRAANQDSDAIYDASKIKQGKRHKWMKSTNCLQLIDPTSVVWQARAHFEDDDADLHAAAACQGENSPMG